MLKYAAKFKKRSEETVGYRLTKRIVMNISQTVSRRRFVTTLGGLALTYGLTGCDWLADKPVTIALNKWLGYEALFLARREGWLDQRQVRLLETESATETMQALQDGRADGAALTLDEALKVRSAGTPVSVVMVFDISAGADMLVVRPDIRQLADLKNRTVGFEASALGALMLAEVLQAAGLKKSDIKPVSVSIDKHRRAWTRRQIDAVLTYEPVASQLLSAGGVKLFDSGQVPNTIVDVLVMRNDVLDFGHARAVRHAVAAHFAALNHFNRNPHDAAYRMAEHLGLSAAEVLPAFKGIILPDERNNYRLLDGGTPELLRSARRLSRLMWESQLLVREDDLTDLLNPDYLPKDF
ncbi:substrate-binding protein involved in ABC-type nitrate/sulfonate/bicarbonate transport system [Methylomonas methanica MC09]|uniref:Substrate-binding protein involved in ABC-type nitrate/sulfonate/bicarbonate transport system n=2 Tax=Methylomonas methanica TaxID=421 RepID=G0A5C1_METMM|nr:substrate-binding protein involved in ABC-type nitrate/sulfonate/bicarbonate transport system [Methylomonas methanica MC09]